MTRTFLALKWRLLRNTVTRTRHAGIAIFGATVGLLVALVIAIDVASRARDASTVAELQRIAVGTTCAWFSIWTISALFLGVDEMVDPQRLALLPLTRAELRTGLVASSLIGLGPFASALITVGVIVGFVPAGAGALVVAAGAIVAFALGLTAARAVATMLTLAQRTRRGRDLAVVIATTGGALLWITTQVAVRTTGPQATNLIHILRWTPPGFAGQAILEASRGRVVAGTGNLTVAVACTALLGWAWLTGVERLWSSPGDSTGAPTTANVASRARLPGTEHTAPIHKELRYLVRSPSRRSATLISFVLGTSLLLLQALRQEIRPTASLVLLAPIAGLFALNSVHNQLGHDAASLWLEVESGGPNRWQLLGRGISWLPALVGPAVPAAIAIAWRSGGWSTAPVAIGLALACAGIPLGVGAIVSTLTPIAIPDANPFANREANTGKGCIAGLVALMAMTVDFVLALPVIVAVALAYQRSVAAAALALVPIALYATLVWWAGIALAVRRIRGHEPELLLAVAQPR